MVDGINDKYESMIHDAKAFNVKGKMKESVKDFDHIPA